MIWEYLESECGDWRFLRIQTTDTVKNLNQKKKKRNNQKRQSKRNSNCFIKKTSRIRLTQNQGKRMIQGEIGQWYTVHLQEKDKNWEFNHWVWQGEGDRGIIFLEELWWTKMFRVSWGQNRRWGQSNKCSTYCGICYADRQGGIKRLLWSAALVSF